MDLHIDKEQNKVKDNSNCTTKDATESIQTLIQ